MDLERATVSFHPSPFTALICNSRRRILGMSIANRNQQIIIFNSESPLKLCCCILQVVASSLFVSFQLPGVVDFFT